MLSGIATTDCDKWVDLSAIPEQDAVEALPLLHDSLNLNERAMALRKEFLHILDTLTEGDEYMLII